jgi:hypothetical protein
MFEPIRFCRLRMSVPLCLALLGMVRTVGAAAFVVTPPEVALEGNFARAQLLVTATLPAGSSPERAADLTHSAAYSSSDPAIVTVNAQGQLLALGNGEATVTVTAEGERVAVPVRVTGVEPEPKVGFVQHVLPILSKAGCNGGACHASQYGKGGFKLSVFAFAPGEDHAAIVRDRWGRRINRMEPARSLLLLKPTLAVPHGGNRRLEPEGTDFRMLAAWIAGGAPGPDGNVPAVVRLAVEPNRRVGQPGYSQQLRVWAEYSDGARRDVTHWARFDSMDDSVVTVTSGGHATAVGRGQGPVMVRFEGQAAVAMFVVPYAEQIDLAEWSENNFVDRLALEKFREIGIRPSPLCDDATFVRRVYLDLLGALPTPEEAKAFLDTSEPDKRQRLIDRLLGMTGDPAQDVYNDQYAAWWALKWADLLRLSSAAIGEQSMWALHNWLLASFRENKPFDQFVRELITAQGSVYSNGPANYYRVASGAGPLAETTAQVFLGVRLQCAQCHHHPFEKYGQDDYYGFAAFFARVGVKGSQEFGLFGGETVVVVNSGGEVTQPRTGKVMKPTPLEGEPAPELPDRRVALADWLTRRDNPFLARNVANRYVAYLLGRGLVEPVDDMRATNPASNEALLQALADDFVASGFNLKHLLRTIVSSRLYQLDSRPSEENAADSRFYSHYLVKRIPAEALLDAVDQATGCRTKFRNLPLGTRAVELPDADYPDYFLRTFGKPKRASTCECERPKEINLAQVLHTLNGETIAAKLADPQGRVARLAASNVPWEEGVTELYLAALSRRPTPEELAAWAPFKDQGPDLKTFYEDLLWALLNSKQFLYVH